MMPASSATRVSERIAARYAALPPPPPAKRALSDDDAAAILLGIQEQGSPKRSKLTADSPVQSIEGTPAKSAAEESGPLLMRTHLAAANALSASPSASTPNTSLKNKSIVRQAEQPPRIGFPTAAQAAPRQLVTSTVRVRVTYNSGSPAAAASPAAQIPRPFPSPPILALQLHRLGKLQEMQAANQPSAGPNASTS